MSLEHDIRSIEGYYELGMYDDALNEIASLSAGHQMNPAIVSISGHCHIGRKDWGKGLDAFIKLIAIAPKNPDGFLHAAFCLHELGRTAEAKSLLLGGADYLKGNPVFYYNLACYECRLGELDYAGELLEQAMSMDPKFKTMWPNDPDLAPLRDKLRG